MRWPKYWSFSFSITPSKEYPRLISFRMDWLDFLQPKGLSRAFSNTTVQKHQFFGAQLSSQSDSHIHTQPLEKPQPWLKWTGMGEFNSDDHYIYYCGQESLRRIGVPFMVNKRVWNIVLGCNFKNDRMISVCFQGKPLNITNFLSYMKWITTLKDTSYHNPYRNTQTIWIGLHPLKKHPLKKH